MTIFILERVPASLRGDLTRWMLEPRAGVFVGRLSAMVRDKLWERVCRHVREGGAILIHTADTEQGYVVRLWGEPRRELVDFEGIWMVRVS